MPLTKRQSCSVRGLKENLSFFRKLMAAVVSAAMFAAGARTAVTMLVIMMAAAYVCVVNQLLGKISSYGFICSTGDAAQKFNAGVTQGGLSSAADAAADKGIDAVLHKDPGQQTVAASVGVDDFCVDYTSVFNFINFEMFRTAEVLKDLAVVIGNSKFHRWISWLGSLSSPDLTTARTAAMVVFFSVADSAVATGNQKLIAVNETGGNLSTSTFINFLHG